MYPTQTPEAKLKSILVAYDFSETSRKPLQHALAIARHFKAKLYIAYVVCSIGYSMAGPGAPELACEGVMRDIQSFEAQLLKDSSLRDLQYEFLIREGDVWEQLEAIIKEKNIEAVVVGTHARTAVRRLVLGSVAEQVFRQASCPVVTVGPGSREDSLIEKQDKIQPFLFATDFGVASLGALPYAVAFANHFGTKLSVLNVLPAAPIPETFHWSTTGDLTQMRDSARRASQKQFEQLIVPKVPAATELEFIVKFGIPSEQILQACHTLNVDLLVLGLRSTRHAETESHLPWVRVHEIICRTSCPVLTLKHGSKGKSDF